MIANGTMQFIGKNSDLLQICNGVPAHSCSLFRKSVRFLENGEFTLFKDFNVGTIFEALEFVGTVSKIGNVLDKLTSIIN